MDLLSILVFNKLKNKKGGITPTGSVTITSNGTYDVTNFAEAKVDYAFAPFKRLEYVKPSNTKCFINTLIGGDLTEYTIEVKLAFPKTTESGNGFPYGNSTGADYGYGAIYYASNTLRFYYGDNLGDDFYTNFVREQVYTIKSHFTATKIENWVDGVKMNDIVRTATKTNNPICLFQRGINNDFGGMNALYEFKLYNEHDNLISHLVPAKDIAGTICVYDKVRNCYLYNTGTGTLNGGAEIN